MDFYLIIKTIHILSAAILFGTGIGIAFFMFRSQFTKDIQEKYYAAKNTVLADYWFTLPAVIAQPISGIALIHIAGFDETHFWLMATYVIYIMIGLCWLPVVWLQIQMKKMLAQAIENKEALNKRYNTYFKIWFILGWPAFIGLMIIFYLMVVKPV